MAVITISRQFGAGGWTLGEKLSRKFGFHLVDRHVIDEIARREKVSPGWLGAVEKEASSRILDLLSSIVSSGIFYRSPGGPEDQGMQRKKYIDFLTRIMEPMADQGGYVIVGRGAQFVLRGHPNAVHVLLVGERKKRVEFLVKRYGLSTSEAESMIKEREKERIALASNVFDANIDDPAMYDLVLNTCKISFDWAVETVASLVALKMQEESGGPLTKIRAAAPD
jgi:cytidylate kinase